MTWRVFSLSIVLAALAVLGSSCHRCQQKRKPGSVTDVQPMDPEARRAFEAQGIPVPATEMTAKAKNEGEYEKRGSYRRAGQEKSQGF